ncbi:MAG: hypothetical protein QOG13_750 [Sphingomonadales bacterium]|jgi:hypothetical protein|nr:hypothetical protein [Sphingomonadales bacterium]MEA3044413.1 hypothetical protein [Sphingomonadales bacterium]
MKHKLFAIATLLVAACGSQDKAGNGAANAGAGESSAAGGAAIALTPGEWETIVEVTSLNITGGPQLPGGMTPPLPPPTTVRSCLTPEQAARPNANFLTGSGERGGCNYENFSMAGGRIQGTVTCASEGTTMRTTVNGQFGPDSYETESQSRITSNRMTMETAGRTRSRRVGDCPAPR